VRNPKIEAILDAWYEAERGHPKTRHNAWNRLNQLLDEIRKNTPYSRDQILDNLFSDFKEYKAQLKKSRQDEPPSTSPLTPAVPPA
jgi:hypothetical protein